MFFFLCLFFSFFVNNLDLLCFFFFFQAEDGIRDFHVTGVQTCALPISPRAGSARWARLWPGSSSAWSMPRTVRSPPGPSGAGVPAPEGPADLLREPAGCHRGGVPRGLVPLRGPGRVRRGRLLPLPGAEDGVDAAPRREHLRLGDRDGRQPAPRGAGERGPCGVVRAGR